jgi:hypothetical protein
MKALAVLCAESVVTDASSNQISIFNVIETIQAQQVPFVIPKVALLTILERTNEETEQTPVTIVVLCNDAHIFTHVINVHFQGKFRTRLVGNIGGLVVPAPGPLKFSVRSDAGDELGNWTVPVSSSMEQPATVQQPR